MLDFLCKESYDLRDFVALITFLRSPDGCPWDQVQTHESIRRNFLEETYEACEAIDAGDTAHLKEELGDVLMQVLFHTDIEREAGHFDIDDVADAACKKLVYRHPHVFRRDEPDAPALSGRIWPRRSTRSPKRHRSCGRLRSPAMRRLWPRNWGTCCSLS